MMMVMMTMMRGLQSFRQWSNFIQESRAATSALHSCPCILHKINPFLFLLHDDDDDYDDDGDDDDDDDGNDDDDDKE